MKVLIAIEDKFDAVPIVECVHNRGWPTSTQFILVNVIDVGDRFGAEGLIVTDDILEAEIKRRFRLLNTVRDQLQAFMPDASIAVEVCCGPPKQEILLALKTEQPDVVMIGNHQKNKLLRLVQPDIGKIILDAATKEGEVVHTVEVPRLSSRK